MLLSLTVRKAGRNAKLGRKDKVSLLLGNVPLAVCLHQARQGTLTPQLLIMLGTHLNAFEALHRQQPAARNHRCTHLVEFIPANKPAMCGDGVRKQFVHLWPSVAYRDLGYVV